MASQLPSETLTHHHHHHCFPLKLFVPNLSPCPFLLHHHHHHHHHFYRCSSHLHYLTIDPRTITYFPPYPCHVPTPAEALVSESGVPPQVQSEGLKLEDPGEDEELEDIFVLTDEWRDFFAKSEAKRRIAKQQKNKHRKCVALELISVVATLEDFPRL